MLARLGGAAAGGLSTLPFGNAIDSFLHPERGYDAAAEEAKKGYGQSEGYYRDAQGNLLPYSQNGQSQFGRLNNQAEALNNPAQMQNQWTQGYETSPYAKQSMDQAKQTGLEEASNQGLMGSSAALNNIQTTSGNIMQNDRKQYLDDLMQKYMASIGIGQNLYGTGAAAAGQMGQNSMMQGQNSINNANNLAGLKYGSVNAPGQMIGNLLGGAAKLGINYATGGVQ